MVVRGGGTAMRNAPYCNNYYFTALMRYRERSQIIITFVFNRSDVYVIIIFRRCSARVRLFFFLSFSQSTAEIANANCFCTHNITLCGSKRPANDTFYDFCGNERYCTGIIACGLNYIIRIIISFRLQHTVLRKTCAYRVRY